MLATSGLVVLAIAADVTSHALWPLLDEIPFGSSHLPSAMVFAALSVAIYFLIRKRFYALRAFLVCELLLGLFALWAPAPAFRLVNGGLDFTSPIVRRVEVLYMAEATNKGTTHYHLTVASWPPRTARVKLDVPEVDYLSARVGRSVKLRVGRGRLGREWFAGVMRSGP